MAIPDYQTIMLPLLTLLSDGKEKSLKEAVEHLSQVFKLGDSERKELLPSGTQTLIHNRTAWAKTYLLKAVLILSTRRGFFKITDRGKNLLKQKPSRIDIKLLGQFPEFVVFRSRGKGQEKANEIEEVEDLSETPDELIDKAYSQVKNELASEILQKLKSCAPDFFERVVVDLLLKMGYGGSRKGAGAAIGKSGDEGIDGVISEDKLGLDNLYIQAKRWEGTVGRPEIQKFVGALTGQRSRKGVFITTSNFSKEAAEYTQRIDAKVVLIDGPMLADLMIDHNVGVSVEKIYELKRIDSDYFIDE